MEPIGKKKSAFSLDSGCAIKIMYGTFEMPVALSLAISRTLGFSPLVSIVFRYAMSDVSLRSTLAN